MNKNIIYIFVLWSLLIFVSYNVLTVEASDKETGECRSVTEPDDEFYCDDFDWEPYTPDRENVEKMCDASEDYAKNPKNCDKAYKLVEEAEEKTAKEDAICDNEDADTTDIKLCMSEERLDQSAFKIDKDECKEANGEWKKDRCTYYEDEQQRQEDEIIEDWGNTVTDEEQQRYQEEQEYQQAKYEQLAHQYTEEEQKEMNDAIEEASESEDEPEEQEEEESDDDGGDESSE